MASSPPQPRSPKRSPRTEALLFRIWQFASPREWNVTSGEIAAHLDELPRRVVKALADADWSRRIRTSQRDSYMRETNNMARIASSLAQELRTANVYPVSQ